MSLLHKSGTVEFNTEYHAQRKPLWLVCLKLLGVAAMVAVGAAIVLPTLLEFEYPLWQAIAITAGSMLVYCGIAFFFRPEPNTDNVGTGIDKFLWRLHCVLGPGRFTAETLLDVCALVGIAKAAHSDYEAAAATGIGGFSAGSSGSAFDATRPIAPLDPNRFAQSSGNFVVGQIQLDSQRFFAGPGPAPAGEPARV